MGVGFTPGKRSGACRPNTQAIGLLPEERHPIGHLWPCLRRQSMASSPLFGGRSNHCSTSLAP